MENKDTIQMKFSELKKEFQLIQSLDKSEKRFISILGNSLAGKGGSQSMTLFRYLVQLENFDSARIDDARALNEMKSSLPTVSRRLYQLMIRGLQQLDSDQFLRTKLSRFEFETETCFQRKLYDAALHSAKHGEKTAKRFGAWDMVNRFLFWQRRIVLQALPPDILSQLEKIHQYEKEALQYCLWQTELEHFRTMLIAARRLNKPRKNAAFNAELRQIASHPALRKKAAFADLFTESLAADVRGLLHLALRRGEDAVEVYQQILKKWRHEKDWISSYPDLYLALFMNFQLAVFWGTLNNQLINSYLGLLPQAKELPAKYRIDFQRLQYGHLLTLGLNNAKFDLVFRMIPEIEKWLGDNQQQLPVNSQLAFRYNICITCFLAGNYDDAYRKLQFIVRYKSRGNREDILDFSRVLQAVLLFQLNNHDLGEYMLRSARLFFKRNPRQWAFEEKVLQYLRQSLTNKNKKQAEKNADELEHMLQILAEENHGSYPLLGLVEIQCWLRSRRSGKPISEIFRSRIIQTKT